MKKIILFTLLTLVGAAWLHAENSSPKTDPDRTGADSMVLNSGWKIISSSGLSDSGEKISSPDYAPNKNWMPAVVPATVLGSYVKAGLYSDPCIGINNKASFGKNGAINQSEIPDASIPGSPFTFAHWYRAAFSIPPSMNGKTVWLKLGGINWKANVFLNGKKLGSISGVFQRGHFNITDVVRSGNNSLAVQIEPLQVPGTPKDNGCGGATGKVASIGLTPATIYQTVGWDFSLVDGIRDRNMGILRDVTLYATSAVDIRDSFMSTEGVPTSEQANLNFKTVLVNSSAKEQTGRLTVHFADQDVSQNITLAPGETREISMGWQQFPGLSLKNPKLWWPNGKGDPHLYSMQVNFTDAAGQITRKESHFGVRSIQNKPELKQSVYWVNGHKMFLPGGNWVQDAMQRQTPEREEAQIRMIRNSGMNWIRLWSGSGPMDDAFFDLCDQYGIMVWVESGLCSQVKKAQADPVWCQITLDNWTDYILRVRSHPCVFNYVGSNEGPDIPGMADRVKKYDGTRAYSVSSQDLGQRGAPYIWLGLDSYYDYSQKKPWGVGSMGLFGGFCNESGAVALPVTEVIKELIPADKLSPLNKEYANYLDGGGFHRVYKFATQGCAQFGDLDKPDLMGRTGVENYGFKGQMLNAMAFRGLAEQWQRSMFDSKDHFSTGWAMWTVNTTHPQLCSRIFDYSLEADSSLYYLAHAHQPFHLQYDYYKNDVTAVNNTFENRQPFSVRAEVRNLDWSLQWSSEAKILADGTSFAAQSARNGIVTIPAKDDAKFDDVHFIHLQLLDGNRVIDDTLYWRTKKGPLYGADGDFSALNKMPVTQIQAASRSAMKDGRKFITVTLENPTRQLAFFLRVKVLDSKTKTLVRPCFYSDNYFSVPPGDKKTVEIECPPTLVGDPTVVVEGWNIETVELGVNAKGQTPNVVSLSAANPPVPNRINVTVSSTDAPDHSPGNAVDALPDWAIGPFMRPTNPQPVIRPNPDSVFDCPILKAPCHWEKAQTYNPATVVKDGQVVMLYRAQEGPGNTTSRLGYATSSDGIHFKTEPKPVFSPDEDNQKQFEWYGGCEDPRLTESPDGTYILTYTQYTGGPLKTAHYQLGLATSKDLKTWVKQGSPFSGTQFERHQTKSASILQEIKNGHLMAAKVNGKYWMYFGVGSINLATSEDLIHWVPLTDQKGILRKALSPRPGFESKLVEVGPQPVLTDKGIILFFNASVRAYAASQALFDKNDPTKLLARLDNPFLKPELPWEKSGLYKDGTTFIEGLVLFKGQWFVYYGCADSFVGVAIAPAASQQ